MRQVDPLGHDTDYDYDDLNRLITVHTPVGSSHFTYDAVGNLTESLDPLNQLTVTAYDELDRPIRQIDARGGVTQATYDAVGNLTRLVDPLGNLTQYVYVETGTF